MTGKPKKIADDYAGISTAQAIVSAAEDICGELGVSGLKLRGIARRVGIEPASVYNHYRGLDGVLSGVVERATDDLMALLDVPEDLTGKAAVAEFCLRSTRFFSDRKGLARLMLQDLADTHDVKKNAFDRNEARIVAMLDKEAAFLTRHLGISYLGRPRLGQIALSRQFMIISLLAQRWLNDWETTEADIHGIAELATAYLVGLSAQIPDPSQPKT